MAATSSVATDAMLTDLVKSYREFTLGPISTTIRRGVTALLGANGAGKTTLMRLVVGTVRASSGQVLLPGPGAQVGFLPQDFVGPTRATARDYLTYVAWCRSTKQEKFTAQHVDAALAAVGLEERAGSRIGTLSGGMVRRLGIAQALLGDAPVLVLDEPTVGLDPLQRQEVRRLIERLGRSTTVLVSTHLAEDVAAVADHVLVLDSGRLLHDGSVVDLCDGPDVTSERVEAGFLRLIHGLDQNIQARTSDDA